jgi:hypothetical protein
MTALQVNQGEKYALIAIPQAFVDDSLPEDFQAERDLWITRTLPFDIEGQWKGWVGSLLFDKLKGAGLFLISKGPAAHPDILDADNERYKLRVFHFYMGFQLTGFFWCNDQPIQLTGANRSGEIDVRFIGELQMPYSVPGAPSESIDIDRIRRATAVANAFHNVQNTKKYERFNRSVRTFYSGISSNEGGERLHQFIRCVEGFIHPDPGKTGKQFKSRTELFLGPHHHEVAEEFFEIRSAVEHLHDPTGIITAPSEREKRIKLLQRAVEAEALARYIIQRFLLSPEIWPHFEDDISISKFWKLSAAEREKLWGVPFDIDTVSKQFDSRHIDAEALGL